MDSAQILSLSVALRACGTDGLRSGQSSAVVGLPLDGFMCWCRPIKEGASLRMSVDLEDPRHDVCLGCPRHLRHPCQCRGCSSTFRTLPFHPFQDCHRLCTKVRMKKLCTLDLLPQETKRSYDRELGDLSSAANDRGGGGSRSRSQLHTSLWILKCFGSRLQ